MIPATKTAIDQLELMGAGAMPRFLTRSAGALALWLAWCVVLFFALWAAMSRI
jgi:hypothetical protein